MRVNIFRKVDKKMKVCFIESGCPNHEEFKALKSNCIKRHEVINNPCKADVIIQFFCAITEKTVDVLVHELAFIKKAKKKDAIYVACGCIVDALGKEFFKTLEIVDYVYEVSEIVKIADILKIESISYDEIYLENKNLASVVISEGCNNRCSFCKVHYLNSKLKSKPMDKIIEQINGYVKRGVKEIAITGLNTTQYGLDLYGEKKLAELLRLVSQIKEIKKIDLYSVAIQDLNEEIITEIESNDKIELVEVCIQSGSDKTLKSMNIRFSSSYAEMVIKRFSHKTIRTAIIVGFPGENRREFEKSVDFIKRNNLWQIFCNPYMDTPGTPSYDMKDKKETMYRHNAVLKVAEQLKEKHLKTLIGKRIKGYITQVNQYLDCDVAILEPRGFNGSIWVVMDKNSFNYHDIEEYDVVSCEITEIVDNNQVMLFAKDLEVSQ